MAKHHINKYLREALKGENLASLTRSLGLPRGFLHRLVKENRAPSLTNMDALVKLADFLGVSVEVLLTGRGAPKSISTVAFEDEKRKYRISIERLK